MINAVLSLTKMTAGKMSKSGEYENHEYVRLDQVLEILSEIHIRIDEIRDMTTNMYIHDLIDSLIGERKE